MTTRTSKRAQVEALGWTFKAVPVRRRGADKQQPHRVEKPGVPRLQTSGSVDRYPAPGHTAPVRRFGNPSPHPAVRWAYQQATTPKIEVTGVAALAALMASAGASGVMAEHSDAQEPVTVLVPNCCVANGSVLRGNGVRSDRRLRNGTKGSDRRNGSNPMSEIKMAMMN